LTWAPVAAQETTSGEITGKVRDPAGRGIAGAVVIATSESGTRTSNTETSGNYVLPFLRPGTYTLRVEAPGGFTTVIRSDIAVGLNQRVQINFILEPGKTETITVTGAAPLVDIKSTAASTNIKYDEFANAVPLGRSFTDTYAVAPGVVSGLRTGRGNYSISGSSGLENSYLIDGVNITNTGYGGIGAYNIIFGSLGTGVTSEFLDEVQIKTGGFEAEYGQALGGIINTIVKSGTNDFKGSVAWYASPDGLRSSNQLVKLDTGAVNTVDQTINDFAVSVGGPIKKDKIFYFFAYNPVVTTQGNLAQSLDNPASSPAAAGVSVFDESAPQGFGGTTSGYGINPLAFPRAGRVINRQRRADNYAAKFSWAVSPRHQLELTFFGDPAEGERGPQRDNALLFNDATSGGGESRIKFGSNNQTLKWNAVFSARFFLEAQVGHHVGKFKETPVVNDYGYHDIRNLLEFTRGADNYIDPVSLSPVPISLTPVSIYRGGVGYITNQEDKTTQYIAKLTNIIGSHELKYGVEYDDISYKDTPSYTGSSFNAMLPISDPASGLPVDDDGDGVQDFLPVPTFGGAFVDVRNDIGADPAVAFDGANSFRVTRARLGPELPPTKAKEYNAFIQDTWSFMPRLTVKAGVRYTQETVEGVGEFTLPFTPGFSPGSSTYSPSRYSFTGNWAPRIGLTWDVRGDGKSRAYINWGRYFERIPNDLAVRSFSNEVTVAFEEFNNRDLTSPRTSGSTGPCVDASGSAVPDCESSNPVFIAGVSPTDVVAGVKLPYEDELSGGYAFEINPNSSFEVRAIYRTQGRVLEDVQVNAIEQTQNFYYGEASGYPYDPFGGSPSSKVSTTFPAASFGAYVLANPGTKQVPKGGLFNFPKPIRRYKALELIYTKRLSDNWSVFANYRFSRLIGNYEGLFRNDNGQSDPNITSLYDFPNSPLMSGQFNPGPLPGDVSHVLHVYPSYAFGNKLRVGANFSWASGVPRTSLLAHPSYQNAGEIPGINPVYAYWADPDGTCDSSVGSPCTLKTTPSLANALSDPTNIIQTVFLKSYTPVSRGNLGRTPDLVTLDLHADYPFTLSKTTLRLALDIFNVFQTQEVTAFDDNVELSAGVTDPDFLKPNAYQNPRSWRLSARWAF